MDIKVLVPELIPVLKVPPVVFKLRDVSLVIVLSFKESPLKLVNLFELESLSLDIHMLDFVLG